MILNIGGGGGLPIRLIVTAPTGSAVSVTQGTTVLAANEVDGVWTFAIPSLGVWTIHATIEGQSLTQDVDISKVGQYNVTLEAPVKMTLNDNDWATIKEVADESKGANYWAVGDTKQITINGKLSDGLTLSNYQTWVYIIGFDHNSEREGTGIAFQGFKTAQTDGINVAIIDSGYWSAKTSGQWFNMNDARTNAGGWASCLMRSATLPTVKSTLPIDLTGVLKTTTIYSDNTGGGSDTASYVTATQDDLYLLAEFETFGTRTSANSAEQNYQQQYAYYASGNSKVKYRHDQMAEIANWWNRSVRVTNNGDFCMVNANGAASGYYAHYPVGLAPAFKVGGVKYTPLEYIQSTGTQYIDTGYKANNNTRIIMDFEYNSGDVVFGAYDTNGANGFGCQYVNSKWYQYYGTSSAVTTADAAAGTRYVVDYNKNQAYVDDILVRTATANTFQGNNNIILSALQNAGYVAFFTSLKIYYCKIYDNDTLVRDFVPAKDEWGNVGMYERVEGKFYYNGGTGSFGIPGVRQAGAVSVGASLWCEVDGTRSEFIVVQQGNPSTSYYDSTCNGTWLLAKNCFDSSAWTSAGVGFSYANSVVHSWLNNTFVNRMNISSIISQINIPYKPDSGSSSTVSAKIFLLSLRELGWTDNAYLYDNGPKLSYFLSGSSIAANTLRKSSGNYWTRSLDWKDSDVGYIYGSVGEPHYQSGFTSLPTRPAFIIPSDTYIDENNNILTAPPYNAISTLNVGDSVFCKENGVDAEYLLVHKGNPDASIYDSSCDGAWLLRKDLYNGQAWNTSGNNRWQLATLQQWLRDTYVNYLDVSSIIKSVKIPYGLGLGTSTVYTGADGLTSKVFLLSGYEVGYTTADNSNFPIDGTKLGYFESGGTESARLRRIANLNGSPSSWWLRSPYTANSTDSWSILYNGLNGYTSVANSLGVRPAFIVPLDTPIDSSNNIIA